LDDGASIDAELVGELSGGWEHPLAWESTAQNLLPQPFGDLHMKGDGTSSIDLESHAQLLLDRSNSHFNMAMDRFNDQLVGFSIIQYGETWGITRFGSA